MSNETVIKSFGLFISNLGGKAVKKSMVIGLYEPIVPDCLKPVFNQALNKCCSWDWSLKKEKYFPGTVHIDGTILS